MNKKTVHRWFVCIVCLAAVLTTGGFAYYWFLVRGPLAGDTSHDFGEVVVTGAKAEVSHTFRLVNRTHRTITINRVIPECGCVQVTPGSAVVEPGEHVELNAVLSVYATGSKTTPIQLIMDEGKVQFLHVKARGRRVDAGADQPMAPAPRTMEAEKDANRLPLPKDRPDSAPADPN